MMKEDKGISNLVLGVIATTIIAATYFLTKPKKAKSKTATTDASEIDINSLSHDTEHLRSQGIDKNDAAEPLIQEAAVDEIAAVCQSEKSKGNKYFQAGRYDQAIECYTRAIQLSDADDKDRAAYFCNRAAAHMKKQQYQSVVDDCTTALLINKDYTKAYARRAEALENLGQYEDALKDFTAAVILSKLTDQELMAALDRVVKKLGTRKAKETLMNRPKRLPSNAFIVNYFNAFKAALGSADPSELDDLNTQLAANEHDAELLYKRALVNKALKRFQEADEDLTNCVHAANFADFAFAAQALTEYGSFMQLKTETEEAEKAFERAIDLNPQYTTAYVKQGVLYVEKLDFAKSLELFDKAMEISQTDPDVYVFRGQLHIMTGNLEAALKDLQQCIEICQSMPSAYIQLGLVYDKLGMPDKSKETFLTASTLFPNQADVMSYFAEMLVETNQVDEGLKKLDAAAEADSSNVFPLLHKAQVKLNLGDVQGAMDALEHVIQVDPACDTAYSQLAQIYMQLGRVDQAVRYFDKAIETLRTETELVDAFCCRETAIAQAQMAAMLNSRA